MMSQTNSNQSIHSTHYIQYNLNLHNKCSNNLLMQLHIVQCKQKMIFQTLKHVVV